jgi:hypothetical protein
MTGPSTPQHDARGTGSHYQPSLSVVLIIVVLFVAATFFMVRAVSPSSPGATTTTTPSGVTTTTLPTIEKSKVRVQVANGTAVTGLAATYTQKLMTLDWDTLPPGNGPHVSATVIYFNTGYQKAALLIASEIKVAASAVHSLGKLNPITGSASDDVIIVLGPNAAIS